MAVSTSLEIPSARRPPTTGSSIKPPYSMAPKKLASGLGAGTSTDIDVFPLPLLSKGGGKRVTFLPLTATTTTTAEVDRNGQTCRGESSIGSETFLLQQPAETVVGRGERSQTNINNSSKSASASAVVIADKLASSEVHLPVVSRRRSSLLVTTAEVPPPPTLQLRSKYDLEISRPIDVCSASTNSIFYTVPTKPSATSAGRDFLGSPSIFKGFRDLREPTRFVTVSKKKESASFPPLGSWSKSTTSLTTKTTGSPTGKTISRTKVGRLNVNVVKPRLPRSASLQLPPGGPKIDVPEIKITAEDPLTMPIRVRMRRDEYYYMDTTSKSTQTDNENDESSTMSVSPFPGDQQSLSEISTSSKVDRSTSPIQEIQPLLSNTPTISRIEDLEKVTGHFVIQRFFTRTEQEFTSWLENQLGSSSMRVSAGVQAGDEPEVRTTPVLPAPPQIAVTEAPEVDAVEVDVPIPGPVADEGRLTPPPTLRREESALAIELQGEASKDTIKTETPEDNTEIVQEEETAVQVFKLEDTQPDGASEEPQNCQSTDLIKCECFASFYVHEENIARLLISLSPRASTMVAETNFFTTSTSVVTASVEDDESTELKKERIAKFEALLTSTKSQMTRCSSKSKKSATEYRKSKSTESIAAYSDQSLSCSETACEMFPDFVFPRPASWRSEATTRRIRRSNSVDSCLGTDYSSIKTRYDSGTSTLGRDKFSSEAFDLVQEGGMAKTTTTTLVEQFRAEISESVEIKSQEALSTAREKPQTSQRTSGRGRPKAANVRRAAATKSRDVQETLSLDSDTESDLIKSENYHARSEAESDDSDLTTTDGDAMVEDEIIYRRGETFTDEDEEDEDRRLFGLLSDEDHLRLRRKKLQMDKLRMDLQKTIRNTCTQTNRSLMSSAWSEVSGTSCSTTTDSCLDLEVVAKKCPTEQQLRGGKRHSYLPSSGSSLNYVNFSMNLNVKAEDTSKLKFSINLPGKQGKGSGGGTSGGPKLQDRKSIGAGGGASRTAQQDLPSLWAHVRNRMDSTVGTIQGTPIQAYVDSKPGGGASGRSTKTEAAAEVTPTELAKSDGANTTEDQPHGEQPHQSLRHQQLLQHKAKKNSDRIKRSLARLSKLLETDGSQRK